MTDTTTAEASESAGFAAAYRREQRAHLTDDHGLRDGLPEGADLEALHRQAHEDAEQFALQPGFDREWAAASPHQHDCDNLDPSYIRCPCCGSVYLETADTVPAQAAVKIRLEPSEPRGLNFHWGDGSRIAWDGQVTEVDAVGRLELWCRNCGHTFHDDRVRREGYKPPRIVIVVEGGIATVAQRPDGIEVVIVDYDMDAEDECVVKIDGPEGSYAAPDSTLSDIAEHESREDPEAAPEVA